MYRNQEVPISNDEYSPITQESIAKMQSNPNISYDLGQLILALAMFWEGQGQSCWQLSFATGSKFEGQFKLNINQKTAKLFLIPERCFTKIEQDITNTDINDYIILYPDGHEPQKRPMPSAKLPKLSASQDSQIWLKDFLIGLDITTILNNFIREVKIRLI